MAIPLPEEAVGRPDERQVGALLRRERERLGVALDDLAARTKIRRQLLEALEAGRYEYLPGEAYVKGFVRCYARALALDDEAYLALYRRLQAERLAAGEAANAATAASAGTTAGQTAEAKRHEGLGRWQRWRRVAAAFLSVLQSVTR